ncbi:MAG: Benzoyl-CoA reductase/2-hydroxyglutaryl-CoA dehydratase subunit, BcrC/BadD/HgdB [Dehalococcoidales bacterium]|nr:Benzoyl-CoA reductase/2-hydroxyglutaryl-CoA dehydratase subunit, BcrC/BadD/HgdB [Dehalococcoidales bacterium]
MNEERLESRLSSLVKGNSPENRRKHALEAKKKGKKVIGLQCTYFPIEVIYAAGMHPWRVTGTWDADLSRSIVYRPMDSCQYCSHALEALLRGDLKFLDGVIGSSWDEDRRGLFEAWCYESKPALSLKYTPPRNKTEICERYFAEEISEMAAALGDFSGQKVTQESLTQAIKACNLTRRLVLQLYELRKRPVPPVSGAEVLGITTASMVMDKDDFNTELQALLPYLERRQVKDKSGEPRILITSDMLDNPQFLEIIESEGCQIVMDDLDTGSRYFHKLVDEYAEDAISSLARRYAWRPSDPSAYNWEEQIQQIVEWVKDFRADGVIELYEEFSPPRQWRAPLLVRELARQNIPLVRIGRGYDVGNVGQLSTRVGAFLETLGVVV